MNANGRFVSAATATAGGGQMSAPPVSSMNAFSMTGWMTGVAAQGRQAGQSVVKSVTREIHREIESGSWKSTVKTALGATLAGLFTTAVGIAAGSVVAAMRRGRGILDLSQASGMSLGQSASAYTSLQAFGLRPDDVPGVSRNVWMQQMMSSVHGVSGAPGTPEYLRSYRERYTNMASSGPLGLMMAQNMEGRLGMEGARFMANLPRDMFEKQLARSWSMEKAFGMNPDEIRRAAQEMTLFSASFSEFADLLVSKIGSRLIPYLSHGLDNAIEWVSANGDKLSEGIVKGVDMGMTALHTLGRWLYADLPHLVLGGLKGLNNGVSGVVKGILTGIDMVQEPVTSLFTGIKSAIDWVKSYLPFGLGGGSGSGSGSGSGGSAASSEGATAPLSAAAPGVAAVGVAGAVKKWGWGGVWNGIKSAGQFLINPIGGRGAHWVNPWNVVTKPGLGMAARIPAVGIAGVGLGVAGYEGLRWLGNKTGLGPWKGLPSSLQIAQHYLGIGSAGAPTAGMSGAAAGEVSAATSGAPSAGEGGFFGGLRDSLNRGLRWTEGNSAALASYEQSLGSVEERRKGYDAFFMLKEIAENTKQTASNTREGAQKTLNPQQWIQLMQATVARVNAYLTEDTVLMQSRI
jgi:hypothetical protein